MSESPEKQLIQDDLAHLRARRRRHFVPALAMVAAVLSLVLWFSGRPDILAQPAWQLGTQLVLWGLCLLVFPAIGVGLYFPRPWARVALVVLGIAVTTVASTGWPFTHTGTHTGLIGWPGLDHCMAVVLAIGGILLAVGFTSGAFLQRRRRSAVYWVSAGLALAALNLVTWMCPEQGLTHVVPSHLGGAAILLALAAVVGLSARARADRSGAAP